MRKAIYIIGIALLMAACSHIAEDEQLIEVAVDDMPTNEIMRNVLLEDFTGQKCANCPKGTEIIEQLTDSLGDALVAVGIHCGPLGVHPTAKAIGLATDLGDAYYNYWKLEFQPVGLVNRHGAVNCFP